MLPTLATIGMGLAWFAVTVSQLIVWGAGIGIGFHFAKKITNRMDARIHKYRAGRLLEKREKQEAKDNEEKLRASTVVSSH